MPAQLGFDEHLRVVELGVELHPGYMDLFARRLCHAYSLNGANCKESDHVSRLHHLAASLTKRRSESVSIILTTSPARLT